MELDLCLALPNHTPTMIKALDLNNYHATYSNHSSGSNINGWEIYPKDKNSYRPKQDCGNGNIEVESSKALSLLSWSGQPNDGDGDEDNDHHENWRKGLHGYNNYYEGEEDHEIVGWPPINSLRKELLLSRQERHGGNWMANHRPAERDRVIAVRNSMYVKVKMEGVGIGRKIDLRLYDSYQSLTESLVHMFDKYNNRSEGNNGDDYTILYQDKEGDWMLAGDVPWETFIESVQRMEILRNDE